MSGPFAISIRAKDTRKSQSLIGFFKNDSSLQGVKTTHMTLKFGFGYGLGGLEIHCNRLKQTSEVFAFLQKAQMQADFGCFISIKKTARPCYTGRAVLYR